MNRDNATLIFLIILFLLTLGTVCSLDEKINAMNKTIDYVLALGDQHEDRIANLEEEMEAQEEAVADLEHGAMIDHMILLRHYDRLQVMDENLVTLNNYLPTPTPVPTNALNLTLTEAEIRDVAALVYLEAGSQSYECQKAIASVIFNRMLRYGKSVHGVIYESGVFSPAARVSGTTPSQSALRAVRDVLENGATLPRNVIAFRNSYYHSFGRPYCRIGNVYFTAL